MGRDAFSGESKLTVKKGKMVQAMEALFSLLYCHPVQEYEVLKPLRDAYLAGKRFGRELVDVVKERWLASLTQAASG